MYSEAEVSHTKWCRSVRTLWQSADSTKIWCRSVRKASIADKNKIIKFFRKAHHCGLVTKVFEIQSLIDKCDSLLFRSVRYQDHCLHHILPAITECSFTWWTDQLLSFSALSLLVGSSEWPVKIVPNMTYNVFGGTLNPTLLHSLHTCHMGYC